MEVLIELPVELKMLLGAFVTLFVTQALKWAGDKLGTDLSGHAAEFSAGIVGAILVFVNASFSNVPLELVPVVQQLLSLAVVVLGAFGLYAKFLKK